MSVFGPQEFLLVTLPGTAKTSRFCSSAQRAVMRVPEYSAASTTSTPIDMPLMNAVADGKILRSGKSSHGKFGDQRAAEGKNLLGQPRVFFGIDHIDAGAKYRDGFALGGDRAAMAGGIDAARHAADNDQSLRGQIAGQPLGHARAVGRGMARSDHGDAGLGQHFGIAANIKDQRRVVDFFQPRRIGRVVQREHGHVRRRRRARSLRARVRPIFPWQATVRKRLESRCLEFGQRCAEDGFCGRRNARPACGALVGPRPWVREMASHSSKMRRGRRIWQARQMALRADCTERAKSGVKVTRHNRVC